MLYIIFDRNANATRTHDSESVAQDYFTIQNNKKMSSIT